MDAYNNAVDKIGDAIIGWSDPDGTFRADREVSKAFEEKVVMIFLERSILKTILPSNIASPFLSSLPNTQSMNQYYRDGGCVTFAVL